MVVLRKAKHSVSCHLQIDKKVDNVNKKDRRRKTDSNFDFFQAA